MAKIPPITIQLDLRPTVQRLEAVALEPGDIIVATCQQETDDQELFDLTRTLNDLFPGHPVVVTAGVDISVKRPKSDEPVDYGSASGSPGAWNRPLMPWQKAGPEESTT